MASQSADFEDLTKDDDGGCAYPGALQDTSGRRIGLTRIRWRLAGAVWRAFAPIFAVVAALSLAYWQLEARALERQDQAIAASAQEVWDRIEAGQLLSVFGASGRLPPAMRAEPMRLAECDEKEIPVEPDGITVRAVLCLNSAGNGRRYLAVGLSLRDAAPVRDWLHRWLDPYLEGFSERLQPAQQGVILHEEFWP